ncbi:MAG: 2-oxoacid:acceptor oxidoreductase family protein [Candidatus Omnitrophota bacterium]|nr:2-oxoacid:acceptor oxidoreductase family protein [Candidatus Omnitrophota bacterium]
MTERIIIAGAGGQGIMIMGKVLAEAAMRENKFVTWLPCYGAEVRGGTAYCMVTVADKEIGSPWIDLADTLIIMNNPSLLRFKNRVKNKGFVILNSSLVKDSLKGNFLILKHDFSDIASRLGNIKIANMAALGAYAAKKKTVKMATLLEVIRNMAKGYKQELFGINKLALLSVSK